MRHHNYNSIIYTTSRETCEGCMFYWCIDCQRSCNWDSLVDVFFFSCFFFFLFCYLVRWNVHVCIDLCVCLSVGLYLCVCICMCLCVSVYVCMYVSVCWRSSVYYCWSVGLMWDVRGLPTLLFSPSLSVLTLIFFWLNNFYSLHTIFVT